MQLKKCCKNFQEKETRNCHFLPSFNTNSTRKQGLCILPKIAKNLETPVVSRFFVVEISGIEPLTS